MSAVQLVRGIATWIVWLVRPLVRAAPSTWVQFPAALLIATDALRNVTPAF